jgi:hypothetical protein
MPTANKDLEMATKTRKPARKTCVWFIIENGDERNGALGQIYMADDLDQETVIAAWRADLQRCGYSGYPDKSVSAARYYGSAIDSYGN